MLTVGPRQTASLWGTALHDLDSAQSDILCTLAIARVEVLVIIFFLFVAVR